MDAPVTRRELREELANYPTRKELHESLEAWAHVLIERMDKQGAQITAQLSAQLSAQMSAAFSVQNEEIARQFRASEERMRDFMRACLEPHDGVPERVTKLEELRPRVERLEAKVFAPKRRRAAKRR
jgi:hypothetical protein